MSELADRFKAVAARLMALDPTAATLIKQNVAQGYDLTTLQTTGAPTSISVTVVHMKATASRLSGFNAQLNWDERVKRLEFYYLSGGDPDIGDVLQLPGGDQLAIIAVSRIDISGEVIIYQILSEA